MSHDERSQAIRGAVTCVAALEHVRDAGRLVEALDAAELVTLRRTINALPEADRRSIGSLMIFLASMEATRCH